MNVEITYRLFSTNQLKRYVVNTKFFTILLAATFLTGCSTLPKSELYKIKSALNYEARKTANNYVRYGKYNKFLTEGQKEVNGRAWDKTGYVVDCDDFAQVVSILMYERGIDTGLLLLKNKNKKKNNHYVAGTIVEENGELVLLITEPQNGTTTQIGRDWWSRFKYTGMRITYTYVSRMDLGETSEAGMAPTAIFNAIRRYNPKDVFSTNDVYRYIGVNEVAKLVEQMREENYDTMDHLELLNKLISYAEELLLEKDILTKNTKSIDSLRRVFTN